MGDYFDDVYLKRLNRYGLDYQSRIQTQRERQFEQKLLKSVYRVEFEYGGDEIAATLERYKQDETETMAYLLTRVSDNIPNGTVLMIPNKDKELTPWMIYYLEQMQASGYNRYIVLRMTHYITWKDRSGNECESWAYMYGQENNMLKDDIKSRSRMNTIYGENLKSQFFVMPFNSGIKKDVYLEVGEGDTREGYVVTGYDLQSTPGVLYVTIDPVYLRDNSAPPRRKCESEADDFYWLENGGDLGGQELPRRRREPEENNESIDSE